jgi:hypothetical protein
MSRSDFWDDQAEAAGIEELIMIAGRDGRPQIVRQGLGSGGKMTRRSHTALPRRSTPKSREEPAPDPDRQL